MNVLLTSSNALFSLSSPALSAVGEATDDGEREKEDHLLGHLPRHRHHLRGVVAVRPHRQNSGGNQTRSAQTGTHTHTQTYIDTTLLFVLDAVRCHPS